MKHANSIVVPSRLLMWAGGSGSLLYTYTTCDAYLLFIKARSWEKAPHSTLTTNCPLRYKKHPPVMGNNVVFFFLFSLWIRDKSSFDSCLVNKGSGFYAGTTRACIRSWYICDIVIYRAVKNWFTAAPLCNVHTAIMNPQIQSAWPISKNDKYAKDIRLCSRHKIKLIGYMILKHTWKLSK